MLNADQIAHLVVNTLVHLLLIVQNIEGLGRRSVSIEDEAEVSSLTLHICEVYQSGVQSVSGERGEKVCTGLTLEGEWLQTPAILLTTCEEYSWRLCQTCI